MPIGSGPALNWSTSQDAAGRDQGFGVTHEWLRRPYRRAPRSPPKPGTWPRLDVSCDLLGTKRWFK